MLAGYASAASDDPNLDSQRRALRRVRCARIFEDRNAGRVRTQCGMVELFETCRAGDVVVVERLGRLGRAPAQVLEILDNLLANGIGLRTIAEKIDTTAPSAALAPALIAALVALQHDHMAKRDLRRLFPAGKPMPPRPARVRPLRRGKLSPEDIAFARQLIESGETHVGVARYLGVHPRSLYAAFDRTAGGARRAAMSSARQE